MTLILQNVITVSRDGLNDGVPSSTKTVRSLRVVEAHLTADVRSTRSTESPLPHKEEIPPNLLGSVWARQQSACGPCEGRRDPAPALPNHSDSAHWDLNHKQARIKFGVSSGRAVAQDARRAAKNAETRARAVGASNRGRCPYWCHVPAPMYHAPHTNPYWPYSYLPPSRPSIQ